jgi:DNA-binding MarR family transcriptional regulator
MSKRQLLAYLDEARHADAEQVAEQLEMDYSAASMGLLRLTRHGLVERRLDPDRGTYWYRLSAKGRARLEYLDG